jgi:hypothetical protein
MTSRNPGHALQGTVVVSHPVHQHAYETVIAAQEAGALRRFVTGIYFTGRGLTSRRLLEKLPSALEQKLTRELMRRWHPDLDTEYVHTILRYHIVATAVSTRRSLGRSIWSSGHTAGSTRLSLVCCLSCKA